MGPPWRYREAMTIRFGLRLDQELYEKIRTAAKSQDRSINWWITRVLREATTPTCQINPNPDKH